MSKLFLTVNKCPTILIFDGNFGFGSNYNRFQNTSNWIECLVVPEQKIISYLKKNVKKDQKRLYSFDHKICNLHHVFILITL